MSTKAERRKRREERRKRRSNEELVNAVANPPEHVEPDPPADMSEAETPKDEPDPKDEPAPTGVRVVLECGIDKREHVFPEETTIADAAEDMAFGFLLDQTKQGKWPTESVLVTCRTGGATFGPFAVDIQLVVDAKVLRE